MAKKQKEFPIMTVIYAVLFLSMFYMIAIMADWENDEFTCAKEFITVSKMEPDSYYANDDAWTLNLGQNIDCTVFWQEEGWLANVEFKSGTLTSEMIESQRYWHE